MSRESRRKIGIQGKERELMVNVLRDEKTVQEVNDFRSPRSGRIRLRCSSCGLAWDSAHDEEACPLRDLEAAFLSEDWFMVPGEASG